MANRFYTLSKNLLVMGRPIDAAVAFGLGCPEVVHDSSAANLRSLRGRAFHWNRPGIHPEDMVRVLGISSDYKVVRNPALETVTVSGYEFVNTVKDRAVRMRLTSAIQMSRTSAAAISVVHLACVLECWMKDITGSRASLFGRVLEDFREAVNKGIVSVGTADTDVVLEMIECAGTMREDVAHNKDFDLRRVMRDVTGLLADEDFRGLLKLVCACY